MSLTHETRRESYESMLPGVLNWRNQVLDAVRSFPDGATAEEIARAVGKETYTTRPRITELMQKGMIMVVGKRRSPFTNKRIAVFKAVE
jgi:hypothetical protein